MAPIRHPEVCLALNISCWLYIQDTLPRLELQFCQSALAPETYVVIPLTCAELGIMGNELVLACYEFLPKHALEE